MSLIDSLKRGWQQRLLKDPQWSFLFEPPPKDEWVSLYCETTGLNTRTDEIISVGAVRIRGQRIMSSERLEVLVRPEKGVSAESIRVHRLRAQDVQGGLPAAEAMRRVLQFIGSRPLVGYYLEFDVAMLNRAIKPLIGIGLPQPKIEVSALYHDYKFKQLPPSHQQGNVDIDLRFATIMADLGLPTRDAHDAVNDAVMAALAFIKLKQLQA